MHVHEYMQKVIKMRSAGNSVLSVFIRCTHISVHMHAASAPSAHDLNQSSYHRPVLSRIFVYTSCAHASVGYEYRLTGIRLLADIKMPSTKLVPEEFIGIKVWRGVHGCIS